MIVEIIKSHCSGVRIIKFGEGGEESQGGEVRGYLITKESQEGEVVLVLIQQGDNKIQWR